MYDLHGRRFESSYLAIPILVLAASSCDRGDDENGKPLPDLDDDDVLYADLYPALGRSGRIRFAGRLVVEEKDDLAEISETTPLEESRQDEVESAPFALSVAGRTLQGVCDEEGFFELIAEGLALPPGEQEWTVGPREGGEPWGRARGTVLAEDDRGVVVTSDIDKTYLVAKFESAGGLASLLRQKASDRVALPGARELYRSIAATGRPIVFLSGSPRFFKRTLEAKFRADELAVSALHLKDLGGSIRQGGIASVTEQVGFKLEGLLQQRRNLPPAAPEILLGDDSEADFVVYRIYRDAISGRISAGSLAARLQALGVSERDAGRAADLLRELGDPPLAGPVLLAAIRRTGTPSERYSLDEYLDGDIVAVADSFQLALVLADRGHLDAAAAARVRDAMVESGADRAALDATAREAAGNGLFHEGVLEAAGR
ncbi:MAG: hypothetical protein HY720_05005 [Planctomycetes bacterium]|nr:hypothetical protein [Planctomycetota bacterium]